MHIDILSLFPGYFKGPFDESMIARARKKGLININLIDIRDYAKPRRKVDDRPYGGGPGMILKPEPVTQAIRSQRTEASKVIYFSPQGNPLDAALCHQFAEEKHLILLCGHYEGIDERILNDVDYQISIGDFVLTNGCIAAIAFTDAICRLIPGFIGDETAAGEDSFENGILDHPHWTKPRVFEGQEVPEILLSGDHKKIEQWRRQQAIKKTRAMRPDLLKKLRKPAND